MHKKTKKVFFFAERYVIIEPMKTGAANGTERLTRV